MGYPGGKSGPGVYHRIINLIPPHTTYIEPFLGGGAIMLKKKPAAYNIGLDLDADIIARWRSRIGENGLAAGERCPCGAMTLKRAETRGQEATHDLSCSFYGGIKVRRAAGGIGDPAARRRDLVEAAKLPRPAAPGENAAFRRRRENPPLADPHGDPAAPGPRFRFLRGDALTFLASYPFEADALIYCDPPYLMETRSSGRLYRHEFSDEQHRELLTTALSLPCRVMISGYWSEMYAEAFSGWNAMSFEAMTRGGMATEWVWYNFEAPVELHDYRYLGATWRERQDLSRMVRSWTGKLQKMSPLKKQALLSAIAGHCGNAEGILVQAAGASGVSPRSIRQ